jgi:hypothetical protein
MDPIDFNNVLGRKPFQPVRIVMKDGRSFAVLSRRFVLIGADFLNVGSQAVGYDEGVWGDYEHLQLKDVLKIEPLISPPAATSM